MSDILEEIYEKISGIKENEFTLENEHLHSCIKALEEEAFSKNKYNEVSKNKYNEICNIFKKYEKIGEIDVAKKFLETGIVPKNHMIERTIKNVKEEGNYANITSGSNILFIGSGPYPETAITLQDIYKCEITCVDKCRESVDTSKKIIKKMNLEDTIKIKYGWGEKMDFSDFTHVFLAAHVEKKENIVKKIGINKIIIARFGEEDRSFIYNTFDFMKYFGDTIKILGELRTRKNSIHSAVIFERTII